ncbi:beta-galactosidase trimerization domain-containing protein [Streptomyces sp. NPDC001544]|uniref:beta-galactosidase trimerization domain-containing protein n=1 Tax=Streptomyces sp. NPDC001544 TaxID=3364584 RepID=UPI00368512B2
MHLGGYPAPLREVLGLRVEEFWPLSEKETVDVRHPDGTVGRADLWSEAVVPEGADVVAEFGSGHLAGRPAVTRHSFGEGHAWYLATRLAPGAMRALIDDVCRTASVAPVLPGLPEHVQAAVREGDGGRFVFLLNHGRDEVDVVLPGPMTDVLPPRCGRRRSRHAARSRSSRTDRTVDRRSSRRHRCRRNPRDVGCTPR